MLSVDAQPLIEVRLVQQGLLAQAVMMVQEALTASHMYSQPMPVRRSAGVTVEKKSFFAPLMAGPIASPRFNSQRHHIVGRKHVTYLMGPAYMMTAIV